jgi:hypothetical protein
MAYGKQAARNIDQQLMEASRMSQLFPDILYGMSPPEEPSPNHRHHGHHIAVSKRVSGEAEVVNGIMAEEAADEACRCLRCDIEVVTPS